MERWHIGSNTVGYVPEGDVYCMEGTAQDAQAAMREEAECFADGCDEEADDETQGELTIDGQHAWYVYDSPTMLDRHFWAVPCDTPDECAAEEV